MGMCGCGFAVASRSVRIAFLSRADAKAYMNWADWTILAILLISCLISLTRGFVKEALSMVNWVVAFIVAKTFQEPLATLLEPQIATPSVRGMAAFAILFAATLVVGAMVNHLVGELVRLTGLSGTDRLFGMVFGLIRGFVVVMAMLLLLPMVIPIDQDAWWQESVLIPQFLKFEGWARETVRELSRFTINLFD
jgi:membrane protein required for colicin V production